MSDKNGEVNRRDFIFSLYNKNIFYLSFQDRQHTACARYQSKNAEKIENSPAGRKVFCNSIGWVKSARALNSWMTSVSYARDCAPKY